MCLNILYIFFLTVAQLCWIGALLLGVFWTELAFLILKFWPEFAFQLHPELVQFWLEFIRV